MLKEQILNYMHWCKERGLIHPSFFDAESNVEETTVQKVAEESPSKITDQPPPSVQHEIPVQVLVDLDSLSATPDQRELFKKVMVSTRLKSDQYILVSQIDENYSSQAVLSFLDDLDIETVSDKFGKVFNCPTPKKMHEDPSFKKACWATIINFIEYLEKR